MYYLKKFVITTAYGNKSELSLYPGLNIIYGPSNTGKSLITELIDFMFGGDGEKLKDNQIEFQNIKLLVDVDGATLSLTRNIGSDDIIATGNVPGIQGGVYKAGRAKSSISNLWLHLMGITDPVKIIQKLNYSTQRLTVRTFIHTFLIKESRMVSENSVLKSSVGYNKNIPVPTITSLLYFATGQTYLEGHSVSDTKVSQAKNEAVQEFVNRSLQRLAEVRRPAMKTDAPEETPIQIQAHIDEILKSISAQEEKRYGALRQSRELAQKLYNLDEKITECRVLKNRYMALKTQYESDIKRLTFITEGNLHMDKIPKVDKCPFCGSPLDRQGEYGLDPDDLMACLEAAVGEVDKLELQIKDLRSADENLNLEISKLQGERQIAGQKKQYLQSLIHAELDPKIEELRANLAGYTAALERAKTNELLDTVETTLNKELNDTIVPEVANDKFDIRGKLKEVIAPSLDAILLRILHEVNYEGISSASFDIEKCDVKVNGVGKQSQGQGYRAFLNTVMALALQEFLNESGLYQPHLLVLDSPILSLSERRKKVEQATSDTMKAGLFQYFVNHEDRRQTIVIENDIPASVDYSSAHVVEFTKEEHTERYGLINHYRD